jgi:hypothetical protein
MIKAKLYMNVHWMVLYKLYVFYSDMKFKMAATAGLSLTLDPMGNGMCERFNRTLLNMLGSLESHQKQNWKAYLILGWDGLGISSVVIRDDQNMLVSSFGFF